MAATNTAQMPNSEGEGAGTQDAGGEARAQSQEKLGGIFWWLLLGLMIVSDIGCVLFDILVAAGLGIAGAPAGALVIPLIGVILAAIGGAVSVPVGFSIATVGWAGGVFLAFNAFMFSMGYYWYNNIPLMEARKLATLGVNAIIKFIPGANMFPTLTISFIVITVMENAKRGGGVLGAVAGAVTKKATTRKELSQEQIKSVNKQIKAQTEKWKLEGGGDYRKGGDAPVKAKQQMETSPSNKSGTTQSGNHERAGQSQNGQGSQSPLAKNAEERQARNKKWEEEHQKRREENEKFEATRRERVGQEVKERKAEDETSLGTKAERDDFTRRTGLSLGKFQ